MSRVASSGGVSDLAKLQAQARERGVSPWLYGTARVLLTPLLRGWFALHVEGAERLPDTGAAIIAANHKSLVDPLFLGMATRRPVRFMAKAEVFRPPVGGLLVRLGAFPVRRGEHDADALKTALAILGHGEVVVVFPEGTRVSDPDALGRPHHGAGRLAVETGVPIVPAAIVGTAHLWLGPIPKPRHVRVAFCPPLAPPPTATPAAVAELVDDRLWPEIRQEYGRLRAAPGAILMILAALGVGAGWAAHRSDLPRLLGVVEPRRLRRRVRRTWRRSRR